MLLHIIEINVVYDIMIRKGRGMFFHVTFWDIYTVALFLESIDSDNNSACQYLTENMTKRT